MDVELAVEARGLTTYYGKARGIVDIDLSVARGEVLGLVGVNGAGKTTFMRTLLSFIRPTSGSVSIFGHSVTEDSVAARRLTTYLPGEFVVPPRLTGHQTLRRFTFARRDVQPQRVADLASRLDVDLSRKVGDLSKGNRQKVALILAFAPQVPLIVLDEPTSGLDPVLQRTFADLVSEATAQGTTVLLSSHVMSEVEQVADRVALLRDGHLAVVDKVATLLARSRRRGSVRPTDPSDAATIGQAIAGVAGVSSVEVAGESVTFACQGPVNGLIKLLARFDVDSLTLAHTDLEDAFFSVRNGDAAPESGTA